MVQYEAQQHMHLRTWSLDTILGLQGVTTQHDKDEVEGSIQLRFDTESAAQTFANELQAGDVLAPGLHMDFDSDQASKRLCKILFAEHVSGTAHVELNFVPAALTDVFESFSLTMSTHIPAEDHVSNHAIPAIHASLQQAEREKTSASHRKLQASEFSLESALKAVQSTVQKLGTFVDDAVAAANFAKEVFTAENEQISNSSSADLVNFNVDTVTHAGPQCQFSFDKSFTKADNSSAGSADITGTCQNCCAHVGATVTLNIDISGGQVRSASVIMEGEAKVQATLEMVIDGQYNATSRSSSAACKPQA
ncbi:TPA: hypothetical protein ACH3X1_011250 [Trebouxia sp. C0004]